MVVRSNRWVLLSALCMCGAWDMARARPVTPFVARYNVQETELTPGERENLVREIRSQDKSTVVLVQGFGCDLGGFEVSHAIATHRAENVRRLLVEAGWQGPGVILAAPVVIAGEPRPPNRRVEIRFYYNLEKLQAAKLEADRRGLGAGRSFLQSGVDSEEAGRRGFYTAAAILLGLLLLAAIVWFVRRREQGGGREDHLLNDEEASALEVLTGGSIGPLVVHENRTVLVGSRNMAKKQVKHPKQVKVNPISIRSAVERQFEEQTLSQLVQAPVHALHGLTPRHSRMLEEAFGIKTIEDLAKLKYFEIAKAMVILSRYEK